MQRALVVARLLTVLVLCAYPTTVIEARAQDIEPRTYSNAPVGVNFVIAGYARSQGGLPSDPSLPVTDPELATSSGLLAYVRALNLHGKSGKAEVLVPYTWLSGSVNFAGQQFHRVANGFADPKFRLSLIPYGAPALSLQEFASYKQDWIVGASVWVSAPLGEYDSSRLVNIGANRWAIKPEVGVSKAVRQWTLEITAGATFFSVNKNFFGGNTRSQDVLYASQGHAIYNLHRGAWASFDATYFAGGRSTINGQRSDDLQRNWRAGGTLALPVDIRNSIKIYASRGVSARTGNSFDLIGLAWQYRWGGGL
jgi:hypothetical protein